MKRQIIFLNPFLICRKSALADVRRAAHTLANGKGAIAMADAIEAILARILRLVVFGDRSMLSSIEWGSVR